MIIAQRFLARAACGGFLIAAASFLAVSASAQTNVIVNSGFETGATGSTGLPFLLANGTNIGAIPNSWTLGAAYTANNSNLQQGSNTNQGVILPVYSGTYSGGSTGTNGGSHYWDGTTSDSSPVTLGQSFTLSSTSNLAGTFALGGRDPGAASASTTLNITGTDTNGIAHTYNFGAFSTAEGVWQVKNFTATSVPAGTYRLNINLAEQQNVDAVAVIATAVPEPSTYAMLIAGGVLLTGMVRRSLVRG